MCRYNKFHGIAFECHHLIHDFNNFNLNFFKKLYENLHSQKFLLILTIFPFSDFTVKMNFNSNNFDFIAENSDNVNIMIYDYFKHFEEYDSIRFDSI